MSDSDLQKLIETIRTDEAFREKLKNAKDSNEVFALISKAGFENINKEELAQLSEFPDISDLELESVVGAAWTEGGCNKEWLPNERDCCHGSGKASRRTNEGWENSSYYCK